MKHQNIWSGNIFSSEKRRLFFEGSVAQELRLGVEVQADEDPKDPKGKTLEQLQKNIATLETFDNEYGKPGKDVFSYQDIDKYLRDVFNKVQMEIVSMQTKEGASPQKLQELLRDLERHIESNVNVMKPGMEEARNDQAFLRKLWRLTGEIEVAVQETKIPTIQTPEKTQEVPTQSETKQETPIHPLQTQEQPTPQIQKPAEIAVNIEPEAPKIVEKKLPETQEPKNTEGEQIAKMFTEAKQFLETTPLLQRLEKLSNPAIKSTELQINSIVNIDFHRNRFLEQSVTSSNILPSNIRKIEVDHSKVSPARLQSGVIQGERDTENGDFWEIQDGKRIQRLSLYEGTQVKILSLQNGMQTKETFTEADQLQSRGIDPEFIKTAQESGLFPKEGLSFGELINTLVRQEGGFIQAFGKAPCNYPLKSSDGKYSPQFLGYALEQYRATAEIRGERNIDKDFVENIAQKYFQNANQVADAVIVFEHQLLGSRFKEIQNQSFQFSLEGKIQNLRTEIAQASEVGEYLALQQPVRGPLTNISEIQYQGKTVLQCKGTESPYIHNDVAKDLITLAPIYKKQRVRVVELSSVYRDLATQEDLQEQGLKHAVADVGKSSHNLGRAIDVSLFYQQAKSKSLNRARLNQFQQTAQMLNFKPLAGEAWHFDWSPGSNPLPKESERVEISTNMDTLFKRYENQERVINPTDTTDIIPPTV